MSKPDFRVYTVIKRDGDGYNLLLQAMPLDGKLVLRTYKDEPEQKNDDGKPPSKLWAFMGNKK